ncbi:MAG: hypothetical protein H6712_29885 [Myxococcales bacterium]|nr:hypothetical protein [Myxococcales bacterium]
MIAAGRILGQRDNVGKLVDLAKAMMESEDPNPRLVHDVIGIIHFLAASDYLLANANPGNDAVFARLMLAEVLGSKNIAEARRLTESKLESDRKEIVSLKDKMDAESTSRKKNDLKATSRSYSTATRETLSCTARSSRPSLRMSCCRRPERPASSSIHGLRDPRRPRAPRATGRLRERRAPIVQILSTASRAFGEHVSSGIRFRMTGRVPGVHLEFAANAPFPRCTPIYRRAANP